MGTILLILFKLGNLQKFFMAIRTVALNHIYNINELNFTGILNELQDDPLTMDIFQLNKITELSPSLAAEFTNMKINSEIELKSLSVLNEETAIELSKFKGSLILGNAFFEQKVLERLMLHTGALELAGLENITRIQAEILKNYSGNVLDLSALQKLDHECAVSLAKFSGKYMSLNALKVLDAFSAKALSTFNGHLFLDGIEELTTESLLNLCNHPFSMNMDGLQSLDQDSSLAFSRKKGNHLSLRGLTSFSDFAAEAFITHHRTVVLSKSVMMSEFASDALKKNQLVEFSNYPWSK